jgi:hypothetical protein
MNSKWAQVRRYRNLVLVFISGLLLPLVTNLASAWLENTVGVTPSRLLQLVAILVAAAVCLWVLVTVLGKPRPVEVVPQELRPPRHAGLIVLVGKGRADAKPDDLSHIPAIEYHLAREDAGGEALRVCWLIATAGKDGSVPVAMAVQQRYAERCKVFVEELNSAFDLQEAHNMVRRIYLEEAHKPGIELTPEQVIADFTGGTTPMSVGMVLACQDRWPMQYMRGRKDEIASTPVLVRFQPAEV